MGVISSSFHLFHAGLTLEMRNRSHPPKPHKFSISMKHLEDKRNLQVRREWSSESSMSLKLEKAKAFNME